MKKILLLVLAVMPQAYAQCTEPAIVPYTIDIEAANENELPACWDSFYNSFASSEVFETVSGAIEGFDGKVLAYNTMVESEFMPPDVPVNVYLLSPNIMLEQGKQYVVSYKYGNSSNSLTIGSLTVSAESLNSNSIPIAEHTNITGATPVTSTSGAFTVPATGVYKIYFTVFSQGNQGLLYLDDIAVQEASAMGVADRGTGYLTMYPNPAEDILNISHTADIDKVEIYGISGQKVHSFRPSASTTAINVSSLSAGVYIVNVHSGGAIENLKLIKK